MATKNKSIGPNVARILAEKIVKSLKEGDNGKKGQIARINKEVNESQEIKKGVQLMKELEKVNLQINKKFDKYLNQDYKKSQYFSITKEDKQWIQEYMLPKGIKIPSVDSIKDEIVLESAFSEAGSPEEIISAYIKKYSQKVINK